MGTAICIGLGIAIIAGILVSNTEAYFMARKVLIEGYVVRGKEYVEGYIDSIDREFSGSLVHKVLDFGARLACKRFQAGYFDCLVRDIQSKHKSI